MNSRPWPPVGGSVSTLAVRLTRVKRTSNMAEKEFNLLALVAQSNLDLEIHILYTVYSIQKSMPGCLRVSPIPPSPRHSYHFSSAPITYQPQNLAMTSSFNTLSSRVLRAYVSQMAGQGLGFLSILCTRGSARALTRPHPLILLSLSTNKTPHFRRPYV